MRVEGEGRWKLRFGRWETSDLPNAQLILGKVFEKERLDVIVFDHKKANTRPGCG